MSNVILGKHQEARRLPIGSGFACFMATVSASSAALVFGSAITLSWPEYLMVMFTAAVLTGGIVFTVIEMRHLTDEKR